MTSLWQKKVNEVEGVQRAMRTIAEARTHDQLVEMIVSMSGQLARNLPAGQRRQWLAKLEKEDDAK